jgi:O-antigen/teichoic acid export membrane protein
MSIVRSLVGYAPAVVLPRLASLVLVLVLTRLISKQEYGLVVLVATMGEAIDGVVSNWVRIALARFASAHPDAMGRETVRAVAVYLITLVPALLFAIGFGYFDQADRAVEFIFALLIYILSIGVLRFPSTVMSVQGDRNGIVSMEATKALGILVLGIAATWLSESFLVQTVVFATVTVAVGLWGVLRTTRSIDFRSGTVEPLKTFLAYGLPIIPTGLITAALASSDRLFLNQTAGAEALALYAAGVMLARQPMDFIFSLAGVRTFPLLMEDYERGGAARGGKRLAELISGIVFITLPAAAGIILVAQPMTRLLLAEDYVATAALVIPVAVVSALLVGFKSFVLDQVFHMVKRNGLNAVISLPAAIVGIGAMLLMVPKWGVLGCAVAYLIQYLFMVAVTFVVTRRLLPFPIPWGDIGRTVLATLAMVVVLLVARGTLEHLPTAIDLAASIVLGIATYVGAALVLRPSPVEDLVPARFRRDKA